MALFKNKKILFIITPLILLTGFFLIGNYAYAGWATTIVSSFLSIFIWAFGLILGLVLQGLIYIASYQDFIHSSAVSLGWATVRDISNMFFVVVLMIIAFGTILHLENYNYKKWLPKLILMAILINFSKTICGLLIDVAQVVMLTFVNAFKDIGAANATDMLGISRIVTMPRDSSGSFTTIVGAYILGIIYLIVAIIVITTMMAVLVMRLVMIWIYVVLSPLAYLLSAFPGGQKYASQWWSEFIKNLIVGPVLAFFIWLSLASLSGINNIGRNVPNNDTSYGQAIKNASSLTATTTNLIGTESSTPKALIAFVVGIGMLIGGLKISQEIGGAAGSIAGKGMATINKGTSSVTNFGKAAVMRPVKALGRTTRNTALGATSLLAKGAGKIIGKNKAGDSLKAMGNIGLSWRSDMMTANNKRKQSKRQKFLEKVGMGEKAMDATSNFLKTDTGKEMSTATHAGAVSAVIGSGFGPVGAGIGAALGFIAGGAVSHFSGEKVKSFTSKTTQKAAANGSREIANARQNVESISSNASEFMRDSSGGTFYSTSGGQAKKNIEQLASNDNPDAKEARTKLEGLLKDPDEIHKNEHNENFALGLAKGIAAFEKGGGDTSNLQGIIEAIKGNNGDSRDEHGLKGRTVNDLKNNVIAYRHSSQDGEHGSGKLELNTLANNNKNEAAKNIIGVDFAKLKGQGIKIDTEALGGNVSGDSMKEISGALVNEINNAQSNLKTAKDHGEISEESFNKRNTDLNQAKEKLSNPEKMKSLSLVNTASRDYGRQERMTTVYHEEMHKGGIVDESLAEGIAKSLMSNKLYGRNAQTGGRHATEIASFAKTMKDGGKNNSEIMSAVDQEIQSRLKTEGKNRADRVINKETGQKESESQAMSEDNKPKSPTINTEDLQNSVDKLSKKFNDFKLQSPGLVISGTGNKASGTLGSISFRALLKKIATTNNRLIKKLSTPLEAEVLLKDNKKK